MPCQTSGPSWEEILEERYEKLTNNPDFSLEVLLCSACRSLRRLNYDFDENPALSIWWDIHKRKDDVVQKNN